MDPSSAQCSEKKGQQPVSASSSSSSGHSQEKAGSGGEGGGKASSGGTGTSACGVRTPGEKEGDDVPMDVDPVDQAIIDAVSASEEDDEEKKELACEKIKRAEKENAEEEASTEECYLEMQQQADSLKTEGNAFFKEGLFHQAVEKYTLAIELISDHTMTKNSQQILLSLLSNRAFCHIKLENYGELFTPSRAETNIHSTLSGVRTSRRLLVDMEVLQVSRDIESRFLMYTSVVLSRSLPSSSSSASSSSLAPLFLPGASASERRMYD